MIKTIKAYILVLFCGHRWEYDGTGKDTESRYYWHFEKCLKCQKRREVMNNLPDYCGYLHD